MPAMAGRAMCDPRRAGTVSAMTVIAANHLHKRYHATVAVQDVSFTVAQGEIFGLLGPNGAGKTTTVEMIAGLRVPDGGFAHVAGLDPRTDRAALRALLGVQLQAGELPDRLRAGEALELFASFYAAPADWRKLARALGLEAHLGVRYAKLSGGLKQRLSIALALVGDPKVAILDELTTGLDPFARRETWDLIRAVRDRGVTILLVTHYMDEAERLCDRLAVLAHGRVVATGTPAELTDGHASLEDAFVATVVAA